MNDRGTILVVDDDVETLRVLTGILQQEGYRVRPANSGQLALASIAAQLPDLVLLDIRMPDMDGFEVCRRLKAEEAIRNIPVIFQSAATDLADRLEGLRLGAVDYVSKPYQREELLARVRTHLELGRLRCYLEELVAKRTAALESMNKSLVEEIQERVRAEKATERLNRELRSVLRAATAYSIIGTAPDGIITVFNEGAELMLGYCAEEVVGKVTPVIFHDSAELAARAAEIGIDPGFDVFVAAARRGEMETREWSYIRKNGYSIDVSLTVTAMRNETGELTGFIGVAQDITDRKRNEEMLHLQAAELEQEVAERQRAQEELEVLNEELEQRVRQRTAELTDKNGELQKAYDELKIAQARLLQQDKMASIGQLAAGVAHEINNPMGFIGSNLTSLGHYIEKLTEYMAFAERLAANAPDLTASLAERRKALKIDRILQDLPDLISESHDGAERVRRIVQELKAFSHVDRAEQGRADLNEGLESTLAIVWNELKYKTTVTKDYGELPKINCNLGQLNQVFMNLLVNAAQAIETQGEIRIRTRLEGENVCIVIADNGSGIPPTMLDRIFEPFFTTKEVGKGTGLGLSIAYDIIVDKHGGTIKVQSEVGKGSTFTISLPIAGCSDKDHADSSDPLL